MFRAWVFGNLCASFQERIGDSQSLYFSCAIVLPTSRLDTFGELRKEAQIGKVLELDPFQRYSHDNMGVTYSSAHDVVSSPRLDLRMPKEDVGRLVQAYIAHAYQPIVDISTLRALFNVGLPDAMKRGLNIPDICDSLWLIFEDDGRGVCYIQEVLVVLILLCEEPWKKRLSMIFDIFRCLGTEFMGREEIMAAAHIIFSALTRVWESSPVPYDDVLTLTETIADHAYTKLGMDIEENIGREKFLLWAMERFKEHRTIASQEALLKLYENPFDV